MTLTRCICDELFASWEEDGIDAETWELEETQRLLYGHYASCNHESPEPRGILYNKPERRHRPMSMRELEEWISRKIWENLRASVPWYVIRGDADPESTT